MAIRAADTITIVQDPIFGSYKLANIAEGLGTLTQDRLAGIAGVLGPEPVGSPVTSTVTDLDLGRTRSGASEAIFPGFLSLAFSHLFQNVDVTIDRIGGGQLEDRLHDPRHARRGAPWKLTRSTSYASESDISFDSVLEVSFTAEVLQAFDGEDIEVTSIDVPRLDVKEAFERYEVRRLLVWNGSKYTEEEFAAAKPAERIRLRAVLRAEHKAGTRNVDLSLRVPENARRNGYIEVLGGGSIGAEIPVLHRRRRVRRRHGSELRRAGEGFRGSAPGGRGGWRGPRLGSGGKLRAQSSDRQDAVVAGRVAIGFLLLNSARSTAGRITPMILVGGSLLAVFIVPEAWRLPVVLVAGVVEIAETGFWLVELAAPGVQMGPEDIYRRHGH